MTIVPLALGRSISNRTSTFPVLPNLFERAITLGLSARRAQRVSSWGDASRQGHPPGELISVNSRLTLIRLFCACNAKCDAGPDRPLGAMRDGTQTWLAPLGSRRGRAADSFRVGRPSRRSLSAVARSRWVHRRLSP